MNIPYPTEAQDDRALRIFDGESPKCVDCRYADTCEDVGGWCHKDDAEQARWESKLDEMRGK